MSSVGDTALIVNVPEAEPLVRRWRARELGFLAHVTVLVPFLHVSRVDDTIRDELRELFLRHPAFEVTFREIGRFPDVVYLVPEPADPFVRLTEAVVARWPEAPPYGGRFDTVIPHLTVAAEAEVDLVAAALPLTGRARAVSLLVCDDGEHWSEAGAFPLGT
ncbi:2'-5' RNA ligase superfamily protein [Nonomuraea solani]|uniref:2'-5' RNA ligase superfamily protein n=1 Tax=Nonomuraea solani TaxID=1144553 RepID=A0A1H5YMM6_9ACTN|nr:2'-5' RNA ligase family protein [Nonomuraea solani]SEG24892.1 2'-5' RNA ligase superfamily protein [Nonomuraea solani]